VTDTADRQDDTGEFWQTEPGWVLLDGGDGSYLPVNQITSATALICDEAEHARVTAATLAAGCPVLDPPYVTRRAAHGIGRTARTGVSPTRKPS
jgi:hypothetical protein